MMCGFTLLSLHSDSTGPFFVNNTWVACRGLTELRRRVVESYSWGIPGLGLKVLCSAQHWCRNPGNESHDGLGSLVVPCYGLSARYFPLLACGTWFLSSFAGLEGGGLKCTRGGARGDRPLSGRRCCFAVSLFTVSTVICLASACEA